MVNTKAKGKLGEEEAALFLAKNGYTIIKKNFWTKFGEIDIIALKKDFLVFFEVKNWDRYDMASLEYALDKRKMKKIKNSAKYFLAHHPNLVEKLIRFDVIFYSEGRNRLSHIKEAFR